MWLVFVAYLLLRKYGGAGIGEAVGRAGAVRHGERAVRLLVGQRVANRAPEDIGGDDAGAVDGPSISAVFARVHGVCSRVLLAARVRLENVRATVDELYLSIED